MDEIVVTGTRLPDPDSDVSYWLDFYSWHNDLPAAVFVADSSGGGSAGDSGSDQSEEVTYDIVISATEDMPKIELNDLTEEQLQKVLEFLARVDNDPQMAAALQEMADRNVTLRITFADDLVNETRPDARATIEYTPMFETSDLTSQGFQPGSVVTITIERDEITNETWEDTLEGILAHEFTHFYRVDGAFLEDNYNGGTVGNSVQDFDDQVYNSIYGDPADIEMNMLIDAFESYRQPVVVGPVEPDTTNNGALESEGGLLYYPSPNTDFDLGGVMYV